MADTMTFILEGRDRLSHVLDKAGDRARDAEKKLAAFGAAIPVAAAIVPFAGAIAGAGVAVAAFGAAVIPQIGALAQASQAQKKYQDAVEDSGAASEKAVTAELEYHRQIAKMPPATREAAAALTVLKDGYKSWSDSLADDTMPVFTKGLQIANSLLPKTSGLVKGTGTELNRLMTIAAGGMATPGFDKFMGKLERFAVGSLRDAVNGVVHFTRVLDTGKVGGGVRDFLDFARQQGPLVGDTLKQIAIAAIHVLQAAAQSGVGLLQLANAAAKVVASLPPGFISTVLQIALAIRIASAAKAGVLLLAGAFQIARTRIVAMGTAAIGASTTMGTLSAMFMTFSRTARVTMAATGIGLLALALIKLSSIGKSAPPDVDRLTTSLGELARTGKVAGEAARAFGKDLGGLGDSLRTLSRPSNLDKTQQFLTRLIGMDSTPVKEAKENLDGVDKALANLVKAGKADLAAAAFERIATAMRKQGMSTGELKKQLGDYKSALADQRFEQELAAQSMGVFGVQAQKTQQALAAQKLSADGLRQSIQALNNVNRQALGGMIGFEAAVDAAAKAAKENAGSLRMVNGELDLNSPKAQAAASALSDLGQKTDEAAASARESGKSWDTVNGIYERGRAALVRSAVQMGLTREEAAKLAKQILDTPSKTAMLRADITDWKTKIKQAETQLKTAKGDKKAILTADIAVWKAKVAAAEAQLKAAKGDKKARLTADIANWKVRVAEAERQLVTAKGSKKAQLTANIADWQRKIASAQRQINSLPASKSTTLTINRVTRFYTIGSPGSSVPVAKRNYGMGGRVRGYAGGGELQAFPHGGYVQGPGTATSDAILALFGSGAMGRVSATEYVMKAAAVRKYGVAYFDRLNAMTVPVGRRLVAAGAGPAVRSAGEGGDHYAFHNTYHLYQRDMTLAGLDALQRQQEARQRVRRPR